MSKIAFSNWRGVIARRVDAPCQEARNFLELKSPKAAWHSGWASFAGAVVAAALLAPLLAALMDKTRFL
ncbi:MAG: hypothetical protein NTZ56_22455 [Acidobacteria bacterium]|nr:hypothetical protein [Acidobacteriota bacterium]